MALLLERSGWRALMLGVDLPVREYQRAVDSWRPDALALSFVMSRNINKRFQELSKIRGLPIFVGLRDHDIPSLRQHLGTYRAAWREAGHPGNGDVCLRIPVYAAPTHEAAVAEPYENITYFFQRHAELTRSRLGRIFRR